jgi:hypothetical protein
LGRWISRIRPDGLDGDLLDAHLARGSAFLLLDGLDEVPVSATRDGATVYPRALLLAGLADALPVWERAGNRTLLTSRPYGLDAAGLARLGLPTAAFAPLPAELQALFVGRWFRTLSQPERAEPLLASLHERDLGDLSENPLLLGALCVVYQHGGELPGDIWELYHAICDTVLHNRYRDQTRERPLARARLAAIAHGMHTGDGLEETRRTPRAIATDAEIEHLLRGFANLDGRHEQGQVEPAAWREDLLSRSGLLLPHSPGESAFYHLSIQEFLAAERIAGNRPSLSALHALFRERSAVPEWRLTLLFLFAAEFFRNRNNPSAGLDLLHSLADGIARAALPGNPAPAVFLADALDLCLAKGYRSPALDARFGQICLDTIADEIPIPARQTLGLCLGRIGDPRILDLRDPAAYVEVPDGVYRVGERKEQIRIETPFLLARFPTTNSQYRAFVEDGGYTNRDWWSDEGWAWLQQTGVTEPSSGQKRRWNAPNQPVIDVSFWEAQACCRWAHGRLPTEREWDAAARGPDGCEYPWCGPWEDGICNSHEAGLGVTSPVGLFPRSAQVPLGLEDLAGNCWEWCDDFGYEDKREGGSPRVLRGGAFYFVAGDLRSTYRVRYGPVGRFRFIGFRCVLAARRQP